MSWEAGGRFKKEGTGCRPGEKRVGWIGPSSGGWGVGLETKSVAGLGPLDRKECG